MVDTLTSPANPTLKALRALHEKKYRRADGRFLAEGLRIVTEALEAGIVPEVLVFAADNAGHPLVARLVAATEGSGGQAIATTPSLLAKLTLKDNPQAVVGVFRARPVPLAQIDPARAPLWLVVQAIRDPGNLGTIMRTGDAVGAGGVILLDDCCDPFGVETVRASMGAVFTQSVTLTDGDGFFAWVRGRGFVAGAALAGAVDYRRPDYPAPTFLLLGNEQAGLPDGYAARCDALVRLPMHGRADSLNVAVAAGVLAYHVRAVQEGSGEEHGQSARPPLGSPQHGGRR